MVHVHEQALKKGRHGHGRKHAADHEQRERSQALALALQSLLAVPHHVKGTMGHAHLEHAQLYT